jgi:hypothetical protein
VRLCKLEKEGRSPMYPEEVHTEWAMWGAVALEWVMWGAVVLLPWNGPCGGAVALLPWNGPCVKLVVAENEASNTCIWKK